MLNILILSDRTQVATRTPKPWTLILRSTGVTVKNSQSKVPKQLFPKWQTVAHLSPMTASEPVNRTVKQSQPIPRHLQRPIKVLFCGSCHGVDRYLEFMQRRLLSLIRSFFFPPLISLQVLSLFDGISGCLVALKQLGISIDSYASSESDDFSKIVTMVRHPEARQVRSND